MARLEGGERVVLRLVCAHLALDCGFVTEQFSMARVAEVFASTDRESREISGGESNLSPNPNPNPNPNPSPTPNPNPNKVEALEDDSVRV